jgi:hypothetical protein
MLRALPFSIAAGLLFSLAQIDVELMQAQAQQPPPRPGIRTNQPPVAMHTNVRTNLAKPLTPPPPGARTNAAAARPTGAKTNAVAGTSQKLRNAWSGLAIKVRRLPQSRYFYPGVAATCVCLGILAILLGKLSKSKGTEGATAAGEPVSSIALRLAKKKRQAALHSCNVVNLGAEGRRLWQFDARSSGFVLNRELAVSPGEPLPGGVNKDWRALWQHKLNVAWLPPEGVFLRVAQLPQSEFAETLSMVELQLEKLSPIPVAQILWSVQVLPNSKSELQTVIVIIVARNVVEEFLGQLEGQGYLADRLEIPMLDQLEATNISEDGAWIYPEAPPGKNGALVAWWCGGTLQNLALAHLPATNRANALKEQLLQMAWAGEMEGWLHSTPRWHLVAGEIAAKEWEPALREGLEQTIEVVSPLPAPRLAALTAARAAQAEPAANLLPLEFSTRYQQQFVDRLWFRGLVTVLGLYLLYVLVFFGRLELAVRSVQAVENQVAALGPTYTNALQLKARYQILKDREELKYAALDCWKAVAEWMPEGLTLDGWNFSDGQKLVLNGTAGADQVREVNDFEAKLRKAPLKDQFLFNQNKADDFSEHQNPGGTTVNWSFSLELNRTEAP